MRRWRVRRPSFEHSHFCLRETGASHVGSGDLMTCAWSAPRANRAIDHYLIALSGVLMGYALVGKGFAYLGVPPIFIGEAVLFAGVVVVIPLGAGRLVAAFATWPSLLLAAMMVWAVLRTLPYVGEYGFDALRDSVVVMYGGFAFVIIALLLDDSRRITTILRNYQTFLSVFVPVIPFVVALNIPSETMKSLLDHIPRIPGYDVPVLGVRAGEAAAHLAGACVFALVGFRKATMRWIAPLLATAAMITLGRAALLTFVLPVAFAMLMLGKARELAMILVTVLVVFFAAYAVETSFIDDRDASVERSLSTRQIAKNVASLFGSSGDSSREALEGTKQWRQEWWNIILADTVYGRNFWTGRGFGLNLADADGFQHRSNPNSPLLRSPHSVHMTILARAGVPGLALWIAFLASWIGMTMHAMLIARRCGQTEWAGLFVFVCSYVMAIVIDASFDVALEGPMLGVWFWCLIGFGIGSAMIYHAQAPSRFEEESRGETGNGVESLQGLAFAALPIPSEATPTRAMAHRSDPCPSSVRAPVVCNRRFGLRASQVVLDVARRADRAMTGESDSWRTT